MNVAREQLQSIVERVERLEEEKKGIADDIKDIYAEAKANGFEIKAIRQIVRDRKVEKSERDVFERILDTYRAALGMLPEFRADGDQGDHSEGPEG